MEEKNIMESMPVGKLLAKMSIPIMISMFVQGLYNIVDSIYVARYSSAAFTALSLAFPIQMLMIAFSVGTGVGINSLLSRRLGQKRFEEADRVVENGIFVMVVTWICFAVFGLLFSRGFFTLFTKKAEVIAAGTDYLTICTVFSFGIFVEIAYERIMLAFGKSMYHMTVQTISAVINIILDPILIFGYFGFEPMGAKGAAIATVIGQIVGMIIAIFVVKLKIPQIHISFKGFKPDKSAISGIYKVGIPAIVMQSITSVMTMGMNKIFYAFADEIKGEICVQVLGAYFKLQNFIFMPVFGLTNGLVPIVGYNYGAKNRHRITKTVRLALISAVCIMAVGTLIFCIMPRQLLSLFNDDPSLAATGTYALPIVSSSFVFAAFSIVLSSAFQALGNGVMSLIASVTRQLVVLLPVAFLLAKLAGVDYTWYAFPVAEVACFVVSVMMYKRIYDTKIKVLRV